MKYLYTIAICLLLSGCSRLDRLAGDFTPEQWKASHPHLVVPIGSSDIVISEPSSSLFVYSLGVIQLIGGFIFLRKRGGHRSRLWWGAGLVLWSAATFSAGTSYQAFSYEIKCAGRALCSWTSWWEIWYMILMVASMGAITAGVAFSCAAGKPRIKFFRYASINTAVYAAIALSGAMIPERFLASFECMLIFAGVPMIVLFVVNLRRYKRLHGGLDRTLIVAWISMAVIIAAYFSFLMSGIPRSLWSMGIWFNANDVLHIGLILWTIYLIRNLPSLIEDAAEGQGSL